ncbi:MAG: M23 family metallopeptidase [Cytophagales bacterium]|nr:M23 family metallopeptidase [Cytophagales bacterium]
MAKTKYYYNLKTLRFERARFSVGRFVLRVVGYLVFGFVFFIGLLLLQNLVLETPLEKQLRAENRALEDHKFILTAQLGTSNLQLADLKQKDLSLYQRLFETELNRPENSAVLPERENLLISDLRDFNESAEQLGNRFTELIRVARTSNTFFNAKASVGRSDLPELFATPAIAPIENFAVEKLVSGFGMRINPFHKGNYHHDGVDVAAPRGTAVVATAPGRIVTTKRSDLIAGYGNYIEIDHGNGYLTRYTHLEEIDVRTGQKIEKGQRIGSVGSSGGSIAPHLHYEVLKNGTNVDPTRFFMEGLTATQYKILAGLSTKQNQSLD